MISFSKYPIWFFCDKEDRKNSFSSTPKPNEEDDGEDLLALILKSGGEDELEEFEENEETEAPANHFLAVSIPWPLITSPLSSALLSAQNIHHK